MIGLVWEVFLVYWKLAGEGDPILVHGNVESGSGNLPHHVCVAGTGGLDCHSSVLVASRLLFLV